MYVRSKETLARKERRRKSKRDIKREERLSQYGIEPLVVEYGVPLPDHIRKQRIHLEVTLNPNTAKKFVGPKQKSKKNHRRTGSERTARDVLMASLNQAKVRSKSINVPFDITIDDLVVPEYCPVFGTKLRWTNKITNDTPSLDRFVPELGYVKGNVCIISMKANRLKNNATIEELKLLLKWCDEQKNS